jgi:hypothetical protein
MAHETNLPDQGSSTMAIVKSPSPPPESTAHSFALKELCEIDIRLQIERQAEILAHASEKALLVFGSLAVVLKHLTLWVAVLVRWMEERLIHSLQMGT